MLGKIFAEIKKYYRDKKFLDAKQCPVHECNFLNDEVEIHYGLVRHSDEFLKARKTLFPFACSRLLGGCLVAETFPKKAMTDYCPSCREAEKQYVKNA